MIMERGDYALDLFTPARHAAVMIGAAAPAAVSIKEMAATYKGFSTADLHRVKKNQNAATDAADTRRLAYDRQACDQHLIDLLRHARPPANLSIPHRSVPHRK